MPNATINREVEGTKEELSEAISTDRFERHHQITEEMSDLYRRKNVDYGNSFGDMFEELGIITAITRIGDKFNRIKSFVKNGTYLVKDESVTDTLFDMANYCIMTIIELERMKTRKSMGNKVEEIVKDGEGNLLVCSNRKCTKAIADHSCFECQDRIVEKEMPRIGQNGRAWDDFDEYEELSNKELFDLCRHRGIKAKKTRRNQLYINLLLKYDEEGNGIVCADCGHTKCVCKELYME